ncbi:MAG: Thioredoxin [candidate division WS6 bacterium OLB20]|uniref:Thioredoxin n=1 Tax=candidate division WS6 bacterium OLB20 TaxID=1617426 RepID=A0A136LZI1_9BACT|nr:MAG: Thioredoxin [candidate division WS6 bacterium OLB20]
MGQPITDQDFQAEVLEFDGVTIVDFWAEWCGPCRVQGPIIDAIAERYSNNPKVRIFKLNVDENPETQSQYHVMSIPTLIFYKGGDAVETMVGLRPEEDIEDKLKELLEE